MGKAAIWDMLSWRGHCELSVQLGLLETSGKPGLHSYAYKPCICSRRISSCLPKGFWNPILFPGLQLSHEGKQGQICPQDKGI